VLELWPGWLTGGGGGQYPPEGSGGQYPAGGSGGGQYAAIGSGGSHVRGYPTMGDSSHGITGVAPA
jgi:hypothetical protein